MSAQEFKVWSVHPSLPDHVSDYRNLRLKDAACDFTVAKEIIRVSISSRLGTLTFTAFFPTIKALSFTYINCILSTSLIHSTGVSQPCQTRTRMLRVISP